MARLLYGFVACALALPSGVVAATLNWKAAVTGSASTAANWNPAQVPTSTDDAVFNLAGSYTVTWNGVTATHAQTYKQGTVTFTTTGTHTVGTSIKVGDSAGDNAGFTLLSGTINPTAAFTIGNLSGSIGSMTVSGTSSIITTPGTSDIQVGAQGTGALTLLNGGRVNVANSATFGSTATATGNLSVSGVGSGSIRSRLTVGGPSPGTLIAGSNGHATLTVDNGGEIDATTLVAIGNAAGSNGTILVKNQNGALASTLTSPVLNVANNGANGVTAGTGSFDLTNFGTATIKGTTTVGDPDGGTGTLHVRDKTTLTTKSLLVNDTHGVLDWTGGTIVVDSGLFDPPGTTFDMPTGGEKLQLLDGATATFSNAPLNAYALTVGTTGTAEIDVLSGSTMTTSATTLMGAGAAAVGTIGIAGAGSTWTNGASSQMVFGLSGSGNLTVSGGAHLVTDVLIAAYSPGSHASFDILSPGTRVDVGASATFGGHDTTSGGSAIVTVTSGATLSSTGDAAAIRILPPATVNVDPNSSLLAPFGEIEDRGVLNLSGGTVSPVAGFDLLGNGVLKGHGTVTGFFNGADSTTAINASGGVLELGDSTQVNAFTMNGALNVGAAEVHVRNRSLTSLPRCTLGGGTLRLLPGGGIVGTGRTLAGGGTIRGNLQVAGTLTAIAPGLALTDTLRSSGHVVQGTSYRFGPGAAFLGSGAIDADSITAAAGSTIETMGSLTLGKVGSATRIDLGGRLLVSSGATCQVNHLLTTVIRCPLGTYTHLGGGSFLQRGNGFVLAAGDTLDGAGTVSTTQNGGVVSPGTEPASNTRFATLTVSGNYVQDPAGRLIVQIGDAPTNQFDKLAVSAIANLGGTLDVRLPAGFAPSPGETFTVMTFGSHTGTFSNVLFQGFAPGAAITVNYNATSVTVTAGTIPVGVPEEPLPAALAFTARSGPRPALVLALPEAARVRIALYSVSGRRVASVYDGDRPAGVERFPLTVPPGVWFARAEITTARGVETRRARVAAIR